MAAVHLGPVHLRVLADVVVLLDRYPLVIGGGPALWSGSQIMAGLGVTAAVH
ncbi:MAG TPA: hypothetical protein VM694_39490 [Polyangium sp.]|nr:hypothetical protein [Polyangium sp.]